MKKIFSFLLISALLLTGAVFADEAKTENLVGVVTEIGEYGFTMQNDIWGEVRVNANEETVYEMEKDIESGDYVTVLFSGAMTASLPPQIYANKVFSFKMEGTVTAINENGTTITILTLNQGEVVVHLPEDLVLVPRVGSYVVLYYTGTSTMSLPPQIGALHIETYALVEGTVQEANEEFVVVKQSDEQLIRVNFSSEGSVIVGEIKEGVTIQVLHSGQMTRSIPPQVFGLRISVVTEK